MKGKCVNLDCLEFDKVVDIPDGEDFVCKSPECGHKLHEVTDDSGGLVMWLKEHKLLLGIVISSVTVWLLLGTGKNSVTQELLPSETNKPKTLQEQPAPTVQDKDTVYITRDTVIYKTDTVVKEKEVVKETVTTVTQQGKSSGSVSVPTKSYSFGKYQGELKNGIPDGDGKLTYTRRVQIAKHDKDKNLSPVVRYAEAGDYFVGSWGNGDIVSGTLYDRNGNIKEKIFTSKRHEPYDISND